MAWRVEIETEMNSVSDARVLKMRAWFPAKQQAQVVSRYASLEWESPFIVLGPGGTQETLLKNG